MTAHEQGFDFVSIGAGTQFQITQSSGNILGGVFVRMRRVTASSTAKRLLIGPVFSVHVMARCYVDTCNLVAHLFVLKAGKCAS